jgi:hypothetical protein
VHIRDVTNQNYSLWFDLIGAQTTHGEPANHYTTNAVVNVIKVTIYTNNSPLRQQYQQPLSQICFCISIFRKHMFPQTTISATIITDMFLHINISQTYVSSDNNISNHYTDMFLYINISQTYVSSDNNISNHYHRHVSVYQYVANICFLRQQYQQPLSHTCFCISICPKHMFPQTTISATIITYMFLYINMSQTYVSSDNNISNHYHIHVSVYQYVANICFLRQQYQQPLSHTCFCISICRKHTFPQTTISATIITYMFLYINMSQTYVSFVVITI